MARLALDEYDYDVCLSFAGEQRDYVESVAATLRDAGVRVFYDGYEKVELWGKNLYDHLDYVYGKAARYCVLFASRDYGEKLWTTHERRSAQARAFGEHAEYILPARFDETEIPGLPTTVGYISLDDLPPEALAQLISEKLGPRQRNNYFPPTPDLLFDRLGLGDGDEDEDARDAAHAVALRFFHCLQRMTPQEQTVVHALLLQGCDAELPENVHMSLDLLRREVELPATEVLATLANVRSLGFFVATRDEAEVGGHELVGDDKMIVLEWSHMNDAQWDFPTAVAQAVASVSAESYCTGHARDAFLRRDFSALSSATVEAHTH